ncbi:unnamed protein product [Menidia menidia]|uniref:(Atlantic silverside) hypothetical protein n=1 Tax=Menidia menidia TaxID=238744 RepID=A0A8S4BPG0_9TELE|nr:unnamed protein product [Menidia menidia]
MSAHPRTVQQRRQNITALPLYYSGQLLKKSAKEKDFKKYFGELRGSSLFLYEDDTQETYTEKLDLDQLKSLDLQSPYQQRAPTIFTLTLHKEQVQLKMENADTGEVWRGYILTVVNMEIPSKLQLLPGQMMTLEEVLSEERKRKTQAPRPPLPPRPTFIGVTTEMPECFYDVTRQEAEQMLTAEPEYGSIILRPSTLPNNYALTLRQHKQSGPVIKNFRVTTTKTGFVIELDTPVTVSSLNDVVNFFIEKTEYRLYPYIRSQPYDTHFDVSPPPKCIATPLPRTKTVPQAEVAPLKRPPTKEKLLPPPEEPEVNEYVVPDEDLSDDKELKFVNLESELRQAIKARRENLYSASKMDEDTCYENEAPGISQSGTVEWKVNV